MDSSGEDVRSRDEQAEPAPFLKWAGGKRQLLEQFERYFPAPGTYGVYHEPFLGGGAVFFHLLPARAVLSDLNPELVEAYQVVRDDVEGVIRRLRGFRNEEEFYYEVRGRDPQALTPPERVARMLYLNRTCFNGLYRLNSSGRFNVPFGRYRLPRICQTASLRAASRALAGVELRVQPFEAVLDSAQPGDLVYLDPPYQGVSDSANHRYCQGIQRDDFVYALDDLNRRGIPYLVSYDGRTGDKVHGQALPDELNLLRLELPVGRSSQATLLGKDEATVESLYLSEQLAVPIPDSSFRAGRR